MIDYLDVSINCKHGEIGNILRNIDVNTGQVRDYRKDFLVKNKLNNSLKVKSSHNGQRIKISGNFVKFLQGHNVWGTNDLIGLCFDVVKLVLDKLGISITEDELNNIKNGKFIIHRVDIAWNYRVDVDVISKLIKTVGEQWHEQDKDTSNYGIQTVYLNQHSKHWAFKLYDKRQELKHKPLPLALPHRYKIQEYTNGIIRCELKLCGKALQECDLDIGSGWSVEMVLEMMQLALKQTELSGSIYRRLLPKKVMQLKLKLRQAYVLWEDGHDLTTLYDYQVLNRMRKAFDKIGVDIKNPPPKAEVKDVKIATYFTVENKLNYPKWAKKLGLIHKPKK